MQSVGIRVAKTHVARLVDRVEAGVVVVIKRHCQPAAKLVPVSADDARPRDVGDAIEALRTRRSTNRPRQTGEPTLREMIDEGRR